MRLDFIMKAKRFFSFSVTEETGSMENNISSSSSSSSSSCSWSPRQSLWLQTTLAESEKKMKAMMTLLEEGDGCSVEQDYIYNKRKPELIQMLEDFNRSYHALAEQCGQLRSESQNFLHSASSSTSFYPRKTGHPFNNQKKVQRSFSDPKLEASDSQFESTVEDPDVECNSTNFHFEYLNRLADELMASEPCKMTVESETKIKDNEEHEETIEFHEKQKMKLNCSEICQATTQGEFVMGSSGWKNTWHELTKLMEESLRQQAELLKRNDEKRKIINNLLAQMESLRRENRAVQRGLRFSKDEVKSNQSSRLSGRHSFNKFFKAGCS